MTNVMQWMGVAEELRPSNHDLKTISLSQVERLFKTAAQKGCLDTFADLFWSEMNGVIKGKPSLQEQVNLLEEQKRSMGRRYNLQPCKTWLDCARKNYIAKKYNEIEYQIRWVVETFSLARTSKPYLLEEKHVIPCNSDK